MQIDLTFLFFFKIRCGEKFDEISKLKKKNTFGYHLKQHIFKI